MAYDRKILAVGTKKDVMEGAGVLVGRALPQGRLGLEPLDPFLMLDHFKGSSDGPGFPEHPHRGFEILTYLRQGFAAHKDNFGNQGQVKAGGLMHIVAGKGMWHGEDMGDGTPGGVIEGLQFWVNLPKAKKKVEPGFELADEKELPHQTQDGGKVDVKVLVGPGSPIHMLTPIVYLEVTAQPGGSFHWDIPASEQGFAYVLEGSGDFGPSGPAKEPAGASGQAFVSEGQVAVFGEGSGLAVKNTGKEPLVFVMAAGKPHREPVVWNGPFVD